MYTYDGIRAWGFPGFFPLEFTCQRLGEFTLRQEEWNFLYREKVSMTFPTCLMSTVLYINTQGTCPASHFWDA